MKCYFCVSVVDDIDTQSVYEDMLEVALVTAKINTSLEIVVLYDGPPGHPYENIIKNSGAKLIKHRFSQADALTKVFPQDYLMRLYGRQYEYKKLNGTFMRLDIPEIEKEDEIVLYSDFDVMFLKDIKAEEFSKEFTILAAPEFSTDLSKFSYFNVGVLVLNLPKVRPFFKKILERIEEGIPNKTGIFDQGYLNDELFGQHQILPLKYNWKPYWGFNADAAIVHFHGLKPAGDYASSGYLMSKTALELCFGGRLKEISGFLYYLQQFHDFLQKPIEKKWLLDSMDKILDCNFYPDKPEPIENKTPTPVIITPDLLNKKIVLDYFVDRIRKIIFRQK